MENYNLLNTINEGADESIYAMPQNIGGSFNFGDNDWQLLPFTAFSNSDQILADSVLYNNLDVISDNKLFDRMKNYESKFNIDSDSFFDKWNKGEIPVTPETYDWISIYKNLFSRSS
ncbi:MAG: hypothetical protein WCT11_00470 [Candidatus Magasanikbacteria bacterium]|jgi:hypothetical protein